MFHHARPILHQNSIEICSVVVKCCLQNNQLLTEVKKKNLENWRQPEWNLLALKTIFGYSKWDTLAHSLIRFIFTSLA